MKIRSKIALWTTSLFLLVASSALATPVSFDINAGGFGYETGWSITQLTGGSWSAGNVGSMASYTTYSFNWDLTPGDYTLYMTDTFGDGLDGAGGFVRLEVDNSVLLEQSGNVFGYTYRLDFEVPASGSAPVPEPSTFLLLGGGLIGFACYRRKLKKS